MVGLVLVALALGIALTIGDVALVAILARQSLGAALSAYLPSFNRGGRIIQGIAGAFIIVIALYAMLKLRS